MRRTVIVRKTSDAGAVTIRAGETVLGSLGNLHAGEDGSMSASFTHSPAFADHEAWLRASGGAKGAEEARAIAAVIEATGIHVWHGVHDMRIDVAGSLVISKGEVRFRPTDAFSVMRSGGLG